MVKRMIFILSSGQKVFNQSRFSPAQANTKKKTKDEVKNKLINSLVEGGVVDNEELSERADNVSNHE